MTKKVIPKRLWGFGIVYEVELLSRISRVKGKWTGYEEVTGQTPDIGEYLDFEFYNIVWWWDQLDKSNATDDPRRIARWLGISHRVGSDICYWLITDTGKIVSNASFKHVTRDYYLKPDI